MKIPISRKIQETVIAVSCTLFFISQSRHSHGCHGELEIQLIWLQQQVAQVQAIHLADINGISNITTDWPRNQDTTYTLARAGRFYGYSDEYFAWHPIVEALTS